MSQIDYGRPAAGEHIPYYETYITLVPNGEIVETLDRQIDETAAFFGSLTSAQTADRPTGDTWSVNEIVGHLADTERVFSYRALRIARADLTPWESVEFDPYTEAADFNRQPLAQLVDEYVAVRRATVTLLRGLNDAAWARRMPEAWTLRSVRTIAYVLAGHELHHRDDVRQRLSRSEPPAV